MATPSNAAKLANLTTIGTTPLPQFVVPSVPSRIRQIDPDGWDEYEQEFKRRLDTWFTGLNTVYQAQGQQLATLIKKP